MTDESHIDHEDEAVVTRTSHAVLWTGLYTGAMLVVLMLGALVASNRLPSLERYAIERNTAFESLFVLVMLIPVLRFLNRPRHMFGSAMIGWVLLSGAYDLAGLYFQNLFDALQRTPLQVLVEGAVVYGVLAGVSWVVCMMLHARRHPILPGHRSSRDATNHSR